MRFKFLFFLILLTNIAHARNCDTKTSQIGDRDFQANITRHGDETQSAKSLIIFPPTGGTNLIDRSYAKQFCSHGYDVYILNSWTGQNEVAIDIELHQRFYTRAQKAIALALTQTKSPFLGLLGTSVGALHASVSAATIERLNAVFVILGGAPISEVIVGSDQKAMQDLKLARREKYGFKDDQENIAAIGKAFQLEPLLQGDVFKGKRLGMVLAKDDTTVAFKNQIMLRDYWQPKTIITLSSGHFWGIVKAWLFHSGEIVEFFETSLNSSH